MDPDGSFLIVVNPVSGRGRGLRKARRIAELLRAAGRRAEIAETSGPRSGFDMTIGACSESTDPPAVVVACGGDGTVQEVAGALAELRSKLGTDCPSLGLAPVGRCNDFAAVMGVSRSERVIANTLLHGSAEPVDLGRVNGRYFCTVATLGVDADVSSFVDKMRLPLRGTSAYLYGALCVLARYRPTRIRVEGEFGVIEQDAFLASTANTSTYGGAIPIVPRACPTDGFLDLCLIDHVSKAHAMAMLPIVLLGRHVRDRSVHFHQTRSISIDTDRPREIWADGEKVAHTPAQIEVAAAAVRLLAVGGPLEHL